MFGSAKAGPYLAHNVGKTAMTELKTSRPYQERFLDGFDRSQLRQEVQKVKPRFGGLRKKYASWALGGALALGGLGVPLLKMTNRSTPTAGAPQTPAPQG